jgi:hypothetical protein
VKRVRGKRTLKAAAYPQLQRLLANQLELVMEVDDLLGEIEMSLPVLAKYIRALPPNTMGDFAQDFGKIKGDLRVARSGVTPLHRTLLRLRRF